MKTPCCEERLQALRDLGCEWVQVFLTGYPVAPVELSGLLASSQTVTDTATVSDAALCRRYAQRKRSEASTLLNRALACA